jgi:hypothetical protein
MKSARNNRNRFSCRTAGRALLLLDLLLLRARMGLPDR